jgi:hypothetical protein
MLEYLGSQMGSNAKVIDAEPTDVASDTPEEE